MLRFALLVFLIANAGYLAWSQGWMATLGWTPEEQSEAYRLKQQVRPEVLSIVRSTPSAIPPAVPAAVPDTAAAAPTAASVPPAIPAATTATGALAATQVQDAAVQTSICLQTEALDEAQFKKLQTALQQSNLTSDSWQVLNAVMNERWMVYMGKFPNDAEMEKRRTELRARKIGYDRAGGNFEPGLSLGRFSSEEAATRELGVLLKQGIRGARVVQERATQTVYALRFARVTAAQQAHLQGLKSAFQGKALRTCTKP